MRFKLLNELHGLYIGIQGKNYEDGAFFEITDDGQFEELYFNPDGPTAVLPQEECPYTLALSPSRNPSINLTGYSWFGGTMIIIKESKIYPAAYWPDGPYSPSRVPTEQG